MKTLLIVWFSRTGGTRHMVEAMCKAGADAGGNQLHIRSVRAESAQADDLLQCDATIFATPENLASMAGAMKEFFDKSYYPLLNRIQGKAYACAICAGSDGHGAARQIARIAQGWRMKAVAEPLIINTGAQSPEAILAPKTLDAAQIAACEELGATMAAGLAMGIFG